MDFRSDPRVWRVDSRPASNIAHSDGVGPASKPAADTPKEGLMGTIPLVDQSTLWN